MVAKVSRLTAALVVVALVVVARPGLAGGQNLELPCRFHGGVTVDCYAVPDGTVVEAEIGGDTYTTSTTGAIYADSTYEILIVPPEGTTYDDGTPVYFKIGDRDAIQIGHWEAGGNVVLDLTDQCAFVTTTVTYVSDSSTLVALSYDGSHYQALRSATAARIRGGWVEIEGATWISSAYKVEDGSVPSWRRFEKRFTVPADAVSVTAKLDIAADDRYTISLNNVQIGTGSGFSSVGTWPLMPARGENLMTVVVKNGLLDTGLIYRLTVSYETFPSPTPTPVPTPTPGPSVTATPTQSPGPGPTGQPTQAPSPTQKGSGSFNTNKVIGIAFFGLADIILIGLFVYLVWRFFIHPRAEM